MSEFETQTNNGTVLIVEDDSSLRMLSAKFFTKEGYCVFEAASVEEAESILEQNDIELLLVDIQLPGEDGLSLIRRVRTTSHMGIFLITKKGELMERVIGLEMGADLYVVKPFDYRELLAYAKNMIRKVRLINNAQKQVQDSQDVAYISFNDVILYPNSREVKLSEDSKAIRLTRDEFHLLMAFLNNPKKVMSRDALVNAVHGYDHISSDRTIDVIVRRLRKKIGDPTSDNQMIGSVYGEGYIFKAQIDRH